MFSQANKAELQESHARLGSVTKALEGTRDALDNMMECILCRERFDNKARKSALLEPCRHQYVDHHTCHAFYELLCRTHVHDSRH